MQISQFGGLCCYCKLSKYGEKSNPTSISLVAIQKIGFVDKAIIHCHDQSLYLLSVILNGVEHFVIDEKGVFIKSFNKLNLEVHLLGVKVGKTALRQQTPFDEMIGLSEERTDNIMEVVLGAEYVLEPKDVQITH